MSCSGGVRRCLTGFIIVGLAAILAACGSSGPSSTGSASATSSSAATTTSSTSASATSTTARGKSKSPASASSSAPASASSPVRARFGLAKCFRSHGIDVPNPTSTGQLTAAGRQALGHYSRTRIRSALRDCRAYAAQAFHTLSPAQRAQTVKFAQCLRSHGIKLPNPTLKSVGSFAFRQAVRSVDRSSPAFHSALAACRSLAPQFGRSGG
jgi:hypothetical protein